MILKKGASYLQRNGHAVKITQQLKLPYGNANYILVWKGYCVQCNANLTWNLDGTYPAVKSPPHPNDIVKRIEKISLTR